VTITIEPYGEHSSAQGAGVEVRWETTRGAGFIDVPDNGEVRFPHGDGFSFVMAGDASRVEAEDGTVLWRASDIA
jgi:hypothetical protein